MPDKRSATDPPIDVAVDRLDEVVARRLLVAAAEQHEDVSRSVRLSAADEADRLAVLKAAVEDGLRTRRFLDYSGSSSWARNALPVVDALGDEVAAHPSADLVVLLQRAAGHLVKVIMRADDSNGMIGDLTRQVLDLHREACAVGVAKQQPLAKWMVRFACDDQDFFEIDPVAYVDALGEKGLAVYRSEVAERTVPATEASDRTLRLRELYSGFPSFAVKYATVRLAVIDQDVDQLVELLGGDLSSPHQFLQVTAAMSELGRRSDALAWARRGIGETSGWQVAKLYDLAAELLAETGDAAAVVELRREHHDRMPSSATYAKLQAASRTNGSWKAEIGPARSALAVRDVAGLIDVLLADGEPGQAWNVATEEDRELSSSQWVRLAEAREPAAPADAMAVYLKLANEVLVHADKRAYRDAVRMLKTARRAAMSADRVAEFTEHLAGLREHHRRRPSFMAMLDKADLR